MNVLVSGVAGDIGFGVGRVLRDLNWDGKLYGIDIQSNHAGTFVYDFCAVCIRADDEGYLKWLSGYILLNDIKVFIPTSEAEISVIASAAIETISGAIIIKANSLVINKSLDKHECLKYLSSCGIPVPQHGLVGDGQCKNYPVIIKPRSGQGSKDVAKVSSAAQMPATLQKNLVWQQYLSPDDEEYTCPVFCSPETGMRILILKRKLQAGFTSSGEVIDNEDIYQYVKSIAIALQLDGVMNIQLRLTEAGPRLFEINPRLSSTLVFRDKMGFRDLEWLLARRLDKKIPSYNPPDFGTRFYRGVQEYISLP